MRIREISAFCEFIRPKEIFIWNRLKSSQRSIYWKYNIQNVSCGDSHMLKLALEKIPFFFFFPTSALETRILSHPRTLWVPFCPLFLLFIFLTILYRSTTVFNSIRVCHHQPRNLWNPRRSRSWRPKPKHYMVSPWWMRKGGKMGEELTLHQAACLQLFFFFFGKRRIFANCIWHASQKLE